MQEAKTTPAKYIFLDVVGFTQNRSVEAQTSIVNSLNEIVNLSVPKFLLEEKRVLFLPTGDGLCISLLNIEDPYDIHLQIALNILKELNEYNEKTSDAKRQFKLRIGINTNIDNLVIDINNNQNIAGAGINMAARVMSVAGGNQIFVSQQVYEILRYREKYADAFKYHWKTVKHNLSISVYQFIADGHIGLDITIPEPAISESGETKLPKFVAYYIAHAIKKRELFLNHTDNYHSYEGKVLLWFLAKESEEYSNSTESKKKYLEVHRKTYDSDEELYKFYENQHHSIMSLGAITVDKAIQPYNSYFEDYDNYIFVTEIGIKKLKTDYPDICEELGIEVLAEETKDS